MTLKWPKKSMKYTHQGETKMSKDLESFEEIFKSEGDEAHCPTCGGEVEVVEKGGKKKMKAKRGMAKEIGNEMDPHKGGKTGSFVDHKRPGSLGSAVDRNHSSSPRKPRNGVVKSEGGEALFPMTNRVQLVEYTGIGDDAALAKQIEDSQDPQKAHSLYTPSLRNLAVENEGGEKQ